MASFLSWFFAHGGVGGRRLFRGVGGGRSFLYIKLSASVGGVPRRLLSRRSPVFTFGGTVVSTATSCYITCGPGLTFCRDLNMGKVLSFRGAITCLHRGCPSRFVVTSTGHKSVKGASRVCTHSFFSRVGISTMAITPCVNRSDIGPFLVCRRT